MTPRNITQAVMAGELPAITAWAERHRWQVVYDEDALIGIAVADQDSLADNLRPIAFVFDVTGYRAAAPAWWCVAPEGDPRAQIEEMVAEFTNDDGGSAPLATRVPRAVDARHFPAPGPAHPPQLVGSIFHINPVICAPWNRLAYQNHGGPHSDWGMPADWLTAGRGFTQAHTIADMLSALRLHLRYSTEMQAA